MASNLARLGARRERQKATEAARRTVKEALRDLEEMLTTPGAQEKSRLLI